MCSECFCVFGIYAAPPSDVYEAFAFSMSFLFGGGTERSGRAPSRCDAMNEQRVQLRVAVRKLAREEAKGMREEEGLIKEIRQCARGQDMSQCTSKAKELVRVRAHVKRVRTTQSQLNGIQRQLGSLSQTMATAEGMVKLTLFLRGMNKDMDLRGMHNMCREFAQQNATMGETVSTMEEQMDEIFEAENEEDCAGDVVSGVLAELGVDLKLGTVAPAMRVDVKVAEEMPSGDLEERLSRLRAR